MGEDPTRDLPKEGSFEARVFAELAAIRGEFRGEFATIHGELAAIRVEQAAIRVEQTAIRVEQTAMRTDIAALNTRLTTIEEKVDSRLSETRPIWEAVQFAIKRLDMKFDTVLSDPYDVRTNSRMLDKRLVELEQT